MNRKWFFFSICCSLIVGFLIASSAHAQLIGERVINETLVIKSAPGYFENTVAEDPIEASMVLGTWHTPIAGEVVRFSDTSKAAWEKMSTDSTGWFNHDALSGGYVFVSLESKEAGIAILEAMGHSIVYVNGTPRVGNPYQSKDAWESWETKFNYSIIPIPIERGENQFLFYCARGRLKVKLYPPRTGVMLNVNDLTVPDLIANTPFDVWGAVVVINATTAPIRDLSIGAMVAEGTEEVTPVPVIQPLSVRKVGFRFKGIAPDACNEYPVHLTLTKGKNEKRDTATLTVRVVNSNDVHKETFISSIDGSVQYYAVLPSSDTTPHPQALVLSLHGAGVEARNQAASYEQKHWATIVCPTNRRPYGYNWEDWGRLDALEVLQIAKSKLNVDENRIYLTGHSMGGHGTYHVGVLYPDQFAAIGPSAGWISFWTYGVRQKPTNPSPVRQMLSRAALPSETFSFTPNLASLGVYILHGSKDDNVPPEQSHMMADSLSKLNQDFVFHEQPDVGHWWDASDEPGVDCVDWAPMFDFFARHARPDADRVRQINFTTPNPEVSSTDYWLTIEAQEHPLKLSLANIRFDPGLHRLVGQTKNIKRLAFDCAQLHLADSICIELDSQKAINTKVQGSHLWLEKSTKGWSISSVAPDPSQKGPHRYGTFKDAFRNRVVLVFGTHGSLAENKWAYEKARFDAERFWYQGNGSVDLVTDVDFRSNSDLDRNVVLYGNSSTNSAWDDLLPGDAIAVRKGSVSVGKHRFEGNNLSCIAIRPRPGSNIASVGIVGGTGLAGMKATNRMPYLSPGTGFPDCVVSVADAAIRGDASIKAAGFFGLDWSVEHGDFVWNEK